MTTEEEDREPKRRNGKRVIETKHFSGHTGERKDLENVKPKELTAEQFGGKFVEGREFFYLGFSNLRAPAYENYGSIEVFNPAWLRLANQKWDEGYRRHEDLETVRWIPSPGMGGTVSEMDSGIYVPRNPDGTWPSLDPVDYIDPKDIQIDRDGELGFRATHTPSGRTATGKSRLKANRALLEMLEELEDEAENE